MSDDDDLVAGYDEEDLKLLWRRFVHRHDAFVWQWFSPRKNEGGYLPVTTGPCKNDPPCIGKRCRHRDRRPLRRRDIEDHLAGNETVGVYQLGDDDTVRWLCLDVDVNGADGQRLGVGSGEATERAQAHTRQLARLVGGYGLPFLVETSGNKGYHLWLFFSEAVPAAKVLAVGRWLSEQVTTPAGVAVEVFPKQVATSAFGNLVKLPLGVHRKTKRRCLFVGPRFEPLPDQWAALRDVGTLGPADLDALLEEHGIDATQEVRRTTAGDDGHPYNSLPCYNNLMVQGCGEGVRDVATFRLACYFRSRGLPRDVAMGAVREWNRLNTPPLDGFALDSKVDSAYHGGYSELPCHETAMDRFCEPSCRLYQRKLSQRRGG